MPTCPNCHDEYAAGAARCATCDVELVPDGHDLPPRVDRLLGVFHPALEERLTAMLQRRGVAHDVLPVDEGRVEVVVDREFRDDLRAELAVNWQGIVSSLDREVVVELVREGGTQPGWYDAPTSAWVDREGRLQVDDGGEGEAMAEAGRLWGPTLMVIGVVVGLFGWYGQGSGPLLVLGLAMAGLGLFLPR